MRILLITKDPPIPMHVGGNQRTHLVHRALAELGEVEMLVVRTEAQLPEGTEQAMRERFGLIGHFRLLARGQRGWWKLIRGLSPARVDRLAHNLGRRRVDYTPQPHIAAFLRERVAAGGYDVIVSRHLINAERAGARAYPPVVIDSDDVETLVYESRVNAPSTTPLQRMVLKSHLRQLRPIVHERLNSAACVWVANESDARRLDLRNSVLLPNIPISQHESGTFPDLPQRAESRTLLTVASYSHGPNQVGVEFFLERHWPRVREAFPDATYLLVGSGMSEGMKQRWGSIPGVRALGRVNDLSEVYADAAFTVAPIITGGGTNIKVLESLAFGRTSVLAAFAHRGFEETLPHGVALYVAKDNDMATGCIELLKSPQRRMEMGAAGKALVQEHYSFEKFAGIVRATITRVTGGKQAGGK